MKRIAVLLLAGTLGAGFLFAQTGTGRRTAMYVAVKTAELKDSTGFFSRALAVLNLGDALTPLRVQGKWMEVRTAGNLTGWVSAASLSSRRITSPGRSVSGGELALAGKGFSGEVELSYRRAAALDYAAVD
ncbi:MAG: SH3 domain-containing protein, partial [Treponema sp.]|nr:SH3 domain-containing protein [Treponema sp.]